MEKYLKQKLSSYEDLEPYQKKLLRLLYLENGLLIERFWDRVKRGGALKNAYTGSALDLSKETLPKYIDERKEITNSRQYQHLIGFWGSTSPLQCQRYKSWLWIRSIIDSDKHMHAVNLNEKTDEIMKAMSDLFTSGGATDDKWSSFFAVYPPSKETPNSETPFIINDYRHGNPQMYWSRMEPDQINEINKLTNINGNKNKTVFAYKKYPNGQWADILKLNHEEIQSERANVFDFLQEDADLFLVIYIRKSANSPLQGILGFYRTPGPCKNDVVKPEIWLNALRYILLLRKPLSIFIANHHENQEFIAWEKARDAQLIYKLSGHGKDSIKNFVFGIDTDTKASNKWLEKMNRNMEKIQIILMNNRGSGSNYNDRRREELAKLFGLAKSKIVDIITTRYMLMAQQMIDSEHLETDASGIELTCDHLEQKDDGSFSFYYTLLDLLMFELLLNAKKSRWISFNDNFNNLLHLKFEIDTSHNSNLLKITVENTSPNVSPQMITALNNKNAPIKPRGDESSGIALCRYLLETIYPEKAASLDYSCNKTGLNDEGFDVFKTVAILTLPSLNTKEKTD